MTKRMHSDSPVSDQPAPADDDDHPMPAAAAADGADDLPDADTCSPALSLATRLRAENDARRKRLRGGKPGPRANPSIWTTLAIGAKDATNKAPCAACASMICVSRGSSSNVVAHYRRWHPKIAAEVAEAADNEAKRRIFINLTPEPKKKAPRIQGVPRARVSSSPSAGASQDWKEGSESSEEESEEESASPSPSPSPRPRPRPSSPRPDAKVEARLMKTSTPIMQQQNSTYMRRLISGLILAAVHQLPIHCLACPELEAFLHFTGAPSAPVKEHEYQKVLPEVVSAVTKISARKNTNSSKKLVHEKLSDIVDESILSLEESYLRSLVERINSVSSFVNTNPHVESKLMDEQSKVFPKDRLVTLTTAVNPGWKLSLTLLENYITLKPILRKVLPSDAPDLLEECDEMCLAESIVVLREVRRVMRALEADGRVSGTRTPRLLKELCDTLDLFATDKDSHAEVLSGLVPPRVSTAEDDRALIAARRTALRDPDAQILAENLNNHVQAGLKYIFMPVSKAYDAGSMGDADRPLSSKSRTPKESVALHCAAIFDINECGLDWMPEGGAKSSYVKLLADVIILQMPGILGDAFDDVVDYKSNLLALHRKMKENVDVLGRKAPSEALEWWNAIEKGSVSELMKQKLQIAPMFAEVARKFLSAADTRNGSELCSSVDSDSQEMQLQKLRNFVESRSREMLPDKRSEAVHRITEEIRLEMDKVRSA